MQVSKAVLVTGGNGGIGSALARLLLRRGYEVISLDLKTSSRIGRTLRFRNLHCDLSNADEISQVVAEGSKDWLPILCGFVHLAGIFLNKGPANYTLDDWDYVFRVNVRSAFWLLKEIFDLGAPNLRSIVLTSSAAFRVGSKDPAYTSSKAALVGLTRSLSISLADRNVRVNCILPGIIDTSMSRQQTARRRASLVSHTVAQRIGKPKEVARAIMFLLGPDSSYLWGSSLDVNGGMAF